MGIQHAHAITVHCDYCNDDMGQNVNARNYREAMTLLSHQIKDWGWVRRKGKVFCDLCKSLPEAK